jgi:hypothetical protein
VVAVGDLDEVDRQVRDRYRTQFAATVAAIGNDPSLVHVPDEHVAVVIELDAVFDQTPGPNAGRRLEVFTT